MSDQKKEPVKSFAITVSPVVYGIIDAERTKLNNQGFKTSHRELADKAIIASYGNQQQASVGSSEGV